ncbi:MAG: hypothetical protein IJK78_00780 [Bacteroidales bacterium]|nr:hypothetical protein [Bacteroidales bacterium]
MNNHLLMKSSYSITIPNPVKVFRAPPKPLSCVRQCYSRYRSATDTARTSLCPSLH